MRYRKDTKGILKKTQGNIGKDIKIEVSLDDIKRVCLIRALAAKKSPNVLRAVDRLIKRLSPKVNKQVLEQIDEKLA